MTTCVDRLYTSIEQPRVNNALCVPHVAATTEHVNSTGSKTPGGAGTHARDRHKNLTNQPQNQPHPPTHAPVHTRTPGRTRPVTTVCAQAVSRDKPNSQRNARHRRHSQRSKDGHRRRRASLRRRRALSYEGTRPTRSLRRSSLVFGAGAGRHSPPMACDDSHPAR